MTATELSPPWQRLMAETGADAITAESVFADLCRRYSEPERAYHTLAHIACVLADLERAASTLTAADFNAVRLAAWFHDVVYDPRANDNEEQSAAYARKTLASFGLPTDVIDRVSALILATKTHQAPNSDAACQCLLDADLAILGAATADYDAYAETIRREYAWVPDAHYREGRRRVLETFLQRSRLYLTPSFEPLEEQARANLRHEMERLQP